MQVYFQSCSFIWLHFVAQPRSSDLIKEDDIKFSYMLISGLSVCFQGKVSIQWASRIQAFVKLKESDINANFVAWVSYIFLNLISSWVCTTANTSGWQVFPFFFHLPQSGLHIIGSLQTRAVHNSIFFINNYRWDIRYCQQNIIVIFQFHAFCEISLRFKNSSYCINSCHVSTWSLCELPEIHLN